ncbi:MAG: hypothetical protein K9J17_05545 [Flavobacteriales bacterium]|nr:hypothetical protein [Flavobacteriales bacterium]
MRKVTIIVLSMAIILTAGVLAYLNLYNAPQRPVYRATLLLDRTDTFKIQQTFQFDEQEFSWDAFKQGREVRLRRITDVAVEDLTVLTLPTFRDWGAPSTWALDDNELFRKSRVKKLEATVSEELSKLAEQQTGYDHSAVMEPLIQELIHLEKFPNDDRYVYVYSDLGQNTPRDNWISDFDTSVKLEFNDKVLWNRFDGARKLKNLSGIVVHLIHRPKDSNEDAAYRLRANYLRARLTELGAEVHIHGAINQGNGNHGS